MGYIRLFTLLYIVSGNHHARIAPIVSERTYLAKKPTAYAVGFCMAGVVGFEPTKCQSQSLVP